MSMAESYSSADMRLSKRLLGSHLPACPQKRICMTLDGGHIPSPHNAVADLQPRPQADITDRLSDDSGVCFGEDQGIGMNDESLQAAPCVGASPMDIDEIVEANSQEICYGTVRHLINLEAVVQSIEINEEQLCEAHGLLRGSTAGMSLAQDGRRFHQFRVASHEDSFALLSGKNKVVAVLDEGNCEALQCLQAYQGVRATAVVEASIFTQMRCEKSSSRIFSLSINIYGTHDCATAVGDKLSEVAAFLQHPFFLEPGYAYFNPQYFHSGDEMKCMTHCVALSDIDYQAKRMSDEVEGILNSLVSTLQDDAHTAQPNGIITPLKRYGLPFAVYASV